MPQWDCRQFSRQSDKHFVNWLICQLGNSRVTISQCFLQCCFVFLSGSVSRFASSSCGLLVWDGGINRCPWFTVCLFNKVSSQEHSLSDEKSPLLLFCGWFIKVVFWSVIHHGAESARMEPACKRFLLGGYMCRHHSRHTFTPFIYLSRLPAECSKFFHFCSSTYWKMFESLF